MTKLPEASLTVGVVVLIVFSITNVLPSIILSTGFAAGIFRTHSQEQSYWVKEKGGFLRILTTFPDY